MLEKFLFLRDLKSIFVIALFISLLAGCAGGRTPGTTTDDSTPNTNGPPTTGTRKNGSKTTGPGTTGSGTTGPATTGPSDTSGRGIGRGAAPDAPSPVGAPAPGGIKSSAGSGAQPRDPAQDEPSSEDVELNQKVRELIDQRGGLKKLADFIEGDGLSKDKILGQNFDHTRGEFKVDYKSNLLYSLVESLAFYGFASRISHPGGKPETKTVKISEGKFKTVIKSKPYTNPEHDYAFYFEAVHQALEEKEKAAFVENVRNASEKVSKDNSMGKYAWDLFDGVKKNKYPLIRENNLKEIFKALKNFLGDDDFRSLVTDKNNGHDKTRSVVDLILTFNKKFKTAKDVIKIAK